MRKSISRISIVALLLLTAMLLSSCAFVYQNANMGKYINLAAGDAKDLKGTVDKVVVDDQDVIDRILEMQGETAKKKENGDLLVDAIQPFDVVKTLIFSCDGEGNIIPINMSWVSTTTSSSSSSKDDSKKTNEPTDYLEIKIGYGLETNELKSAIADMLYKKDEKGNVEAVYGNHHNLKWTQTAGDALNDRSIVYVTYSGKTEKNTTITGTTSQTPFYLDWWKKDTEQGENNVGEIVARGLLQLANEGKLKVNSTAVTINAYPVGTELTEDQINTGKEADQVNIFYNYKISEQDGADAYGKVTVNVTVCAGFVPVESGAGEHKGGLYTTFKYGENTTDTYKTLTGETKKLSEAGDTQLYIFIMGKQSYTVDDYTTEDFMTKQGFEVEDGLKGEANVDARVEAFKAYLKKTMQETADKETEARAKTAIFEAFIKNTTGKITSYPQSEIDGFVDNELSYYKMAYYDGMSYYGYTFAAAKDSVDKTTGKKTYDSFEHYVTKQLNSSSTTTMSMADIKKTLTANAKSEIAENLQLFGLASMYGLEATKDEIYALAKEQVVATWNSYSASAVSSSASNQGKYIGECPITGVLLKGGVTYTEADVSWFDLRKAVDYYGQNTLSASILLEKVMDRLYEDNKVVVEEGQSGNITYTVMTNAEYQKKQASSSSSSAS